MSTPSVSIGNFLYYGKSGDASMCQILPGAMLINHGGSIPIFFSHRDVGIDFGMADEDDFYLVMPGYKLEIYYDSGYNGTIVTYNNTDGVYMQRYKPALSLIGSLKIYYQYTEITDPTVS